MTLNEIVARHCRSLSPCSFFVFIQPCLSRASSCQNPLHCIDPHCSSAKRSRVHFFKNAFDISSRLWIRIIQDVNLVNMLLRSWGVSLSEVILHIGTRVQRETLISWVLFCVIVLVEISCLKWFLIAWSSIIHHYSCMYSQGFKRRQIAEHIVS